MASIEDAIDLDFAEDELLGDELSSAEGVEPTETSISFEAINETQARILFMEIFRVFKFYKMQTDGLFIVFVNETFSKEGSHY
ncbi:Calcium-responsive transcription factor [Dirofilaria immitis]